MSPNRRRFLAGALVGITVLGTGCVGSSGSSGEPTLTTRNETSRAETADEPTPTTAATTEPSPTNTPSRTPFTSPADEIRVGEPPACDGSLDRLPPLFDEVQYGSLGGFSLTVSKEPVTLGETVTFRLENTTGTNQGTGSKRKYNIQRRTDGDWQSIYWIPDVYGYNDIAFSHQPDGGFTWPFTFTQDGLEQLTRFDTPYSVCESLSPGEYRFVYWGLISESERNRDSESVYAIGVRFTVKRP